MQLLENVSLKDYNFLRLDAVAEKLAILKSPDGFIKLARLVAANPSFHVLGEGSNVLLNAKKFPLVIHVGMKGIEYTSKKNGDVIVRVQAGENWSDLVDATAKMGLYGIESLALIPGSVGAAPVQNIGAYGQEVGNVIEYVEVLNLKTGLDKTYRGNECEFAYRTSRFKKALTRDELIVSVTFKLSKKNPALTQSPTEIAEGIKLTRQSKLPDPKTDPNVGSFFLNPIIEKATVERLQAIDATIPIFPHGAQFKTSAAWLIEKSGWKGVRRGDVGVSPKHALVMVNYAATEAAPILALAKEVVADVEKKFGISLSMEPQILV